MRLLTLAAALWLAAPVAAAAAPSARRPISTPRLQRFADYLSRPNPDSASLRLALQLEGPLSELMPLREAFNAKVAALAARVAEETTPLIEVEAALADLRLLYDEMIKGAWVGEGQLFSLESRTAAEKAMAQGPAIVRARLSAKLPRYAFEPAAPAFNAGEDKRLALAAVELLAAPASNPGGRLHPAGRLALREMGQASPHPEVRKLVVAALMTDAGRSQGSHFAFMDAMHAADIAERADTPIELARAVVAHLRIERRFAFDIEYKKDVEELIRRVMNARGETALAASAAAHAVDAAARRPRAYAFDQYALYARSAHPWAYWTSWALAAAGLAAGWLAGMPWPVFAAALGAGLVYLISAKGLWREAPLITVALAAGVAALLGAPALLGLTSLAVYAAAASAAAAGTAIALRLLR